MARAEGRAEGREGVPTAEDSSVRTGRPLARADPEQKGLLPERSMAKSSKPEAEKELDRRGEDVSDRLIL